MTLYWKSITDVFFKMADFHNLKSSALGLWSKRESMRVRKDRDGIAQLETSEFDISAYPYVPPPPPSPEQSQHVSTVPQAQLEDLEDAAITSRAPVSEAAKQSNFLQFQIAKQQKQLTSLKISTQWQDTEFSNAFLNSAPQNLQKCQVSYF